MDDTALPVLFFDGGIPDLYRDLVEGRAIAVGPDDATSPSPTARSPAASARGTHRCSRRAHGSASCRGPASATTTSTSPTAAAAGVVVCYAPQAPTVSTAEHTIALMLAVTKHMPVLQARAPPGCRAR